jgi:hypothetical protein
MSKRSVGLCENHPATKKGGDIGKDSFALLAQPDFHIIGSLVCPVIRYNLFQSSIFQSDLSMIQTGALFQGI